MRLSYPRFFTREAHLRRRTAKPGMQTKATSNGQALASEDAFGSVTRLNVLPAMLSNSRFTGFGVQHLNQISYAVKSIEHEGRIRRRFLQIEQQ